MVILSQMFIVFVKVGESLVIPSQMFNVFGKVNESFVIPRQMFIVYGKFGFSIQMILHTLSRAMQPRQKELYQIFLE